MVSKETTGLELDSYHVWEHLLSTQLISLWSEVGTIFRTWIEEHIDVQDGNDLPHLFIPKLRSESISLERASVGHNANLKELLGQETSGKKLNISIEFLKLLGIR